MSGSVVCAWQFRRHKGGWPWCVYELRIQFGPGYRVYYGLDGKEIVLLLCGGDKGTQKKDIKKAVAHWERI